MRSEHLSTLAPDTLLAQFQSGSSGGLVSSVPPPAEIPYVEQTELRDYLFIVIRRKWLILSVVIVATSIVALYLFSLPSIYESSVTLQLQPKEVTFMENRDGTILRSSDSYDFISTQIKLLKNPQLMRKVVLKLDLEHNPAVLGAAERSDLFGRIRASFTSRKTAPPQPAQVPADLETNIDDLPPDRVVQLDPYVRLLLDNLKVEVDGGTSLATVSLTHPRPEIAMQVVDMLTKIFIAEHNRYETRGSAAATETLRRQLTDLQTKIRQYDDEKLDYLKNHGLPLEKGGGRNLTAERLGMLSSQLLEAENDRKKLEATHESAKAATDPLSIPEVRDSQDNQDLRKALHELEQKRASLIQVYTPEWPGVRQIDSEIKQIEDNINKSAQDTVDSLKSKVSTAVAREAKLRKAYYAEWVSANRQTRDEVSIANLNQQIETSRQLYNTIFQRLNEMEINAIDKSGSIGVVTPATVPTQPIGPARLSKVGIAFLLSLVAGIGLSILLNQFDNTMRSAEDVALHVDLPTLALIPSGADINRFSIVKRRLLRGRQADSMALALTSDARSPTAEAYQHLGASLLSSATGPAPQTILVTSGAPFDGKTTTAINTAVTFAQAGGEVLIIDCDLRRPQLHIHFKISNSDGLTSQLSGQQDIDSLLRIHDTLPNLKLLTAGPSPANPAAVLGSREMRDLLELAERRFTKIIIDSPPASAFADASLLATMVDGVLIVVNSEHSSRRLVRRVKQRLQEMGANILGVVLNQVDLKSDEYYSGYYKGLGEMNPERMAKMSSVSTAPSNSDLHQGAFHLMTSERQD